MKRNSSTAPAQATKPEATAKGYMTLLEWTEHQQQRRAAIDANQGHRAALAKYGLGQYDPSELFASI